MRLVPALVASFFLATFAPPSLFRDALPPARAVLDFTALPLNEDDPAQRRLGRLTYLGGWSIRSNDRRFGGISAMHVAGDEVTAFSDAGAVMRFGTPGTGTRDVEMLALPEGPGSPAIKADRDIEAVAVHGPHAWISFERRNVVWRYRRSDWSSDAAAAPPAMRRWLGNSGSEAMLRLPDGRFIIFSEGGRAKDGSTEAVVFEGDPALARTKAFSIRYRAPTGYRITDAALLEDGRILFLNRAFGLLSGFTAKLTIASPPRIGPGLVIEGQEIAHFEAPIATDNMEALSVTGEAGRTIVWIASDDNLNPLQRTLLLKFALSP